MASGEILSIFASQTPRSRDGANTSAVPPCVRFESAGSVEALTKEDVQL